ncbi:KN motif and ankyrin repeat domain-containing protein 4 [Megalops cyprinoides]|uniref:KN motif and ankyrin repeat domain-containing protein 4 n=1 Tax=Megalops cyprinoides TaxID=118141 RepID=UPI001864F209|nr:KN motif and ankyrin repeat domain-containing protein 4 [Megalops cyprinoides]
MMDKKNANGITSKATESGGQVRKQLPYSVETPYGFHLDLDFLKYVDDIEKGNTIKRVHIQRRNRGPKFSTLPRNFSLPGHAARAPPKDSWASTCTLGPRPKSRVMEVQQIFEIRACDSGSSGYPRAPGVGYKPPKAGEDAGIRAFDEQPLGLHVRPHLLRASSMPVTVMQRKSSDSAEDQGAQAAGDACKENGASENVFCSSDVDRRCSTPQDQVRLHQQFVMALQRIRELEDQVRTIPELQAQICTLQEEKEQLLLKLTSQPPPITQDGVQPAEVSTTGNASTDQQLVPSPVHETDQQSITQQQETEEQEETGKVTEQQLVAQEEGAESSVAQEPMEHEPRESPPAQESIEQEQEETTSAQETVKQEEAEESLSTQETVKQEEAEESPSTQETVKKEEVEESPSAQETVKKEEVEESPSTQETVKKEEVEESPSAQETVKKEEVEESPSAQETVKKEEVEESPSAQEIVKKEEVEESPSAQETVKKEEVEESPSAQETGKQEEVEESPSVQETVKKEEEEESPSAQETVKKVEVEESSSAQETGKQEEVEESPSAQETVKQEEVEESPSAQECVEQEATGSSTARESVEQETEAETPSAQELVKQEAEAADPSVEESVTQNDAAESSALETVKQDEEAESSEKESLKEVKQDEVTEGVSAQGSAKEDEAAEGPSAQEPAEQEAAEKPTAELQEEAAECSLQQASTQKEDAATSDSVQEVNVKPSSQQMSSPSENLTVKALQEKLMALEQKFSETSKELDKTNALLQEQMEENKLKDERIKQLTEEAVVSGKAGEEQVGQELGDLGDKKQYSNPTPPCHVSMSAETYSETKTLSHIEVVSTHQEVLMADSVHIIGNPQKCFTSSSTQTDLIEYQEVSVGMVEKYTEAEFATGVQAEESAPQEAPCSDDQEGTAEESEASVQPESSQGATSDSVEEAGSSEELGQPSQKDPEQEPHPSGSSEPMASHAAIGQYVTKIQGLLNEQWSSLGSGHPEVTSTLKQPASKFSSIQSQLVSSLNVLSSFYSSPGQKGGATRQTGLKSIMKKNDCAEKAGNGGAKKNLKFVGVNGGYETTSSEESSGEDNAEENSSEPEEKEQKEEKDDKEEGASTAVEEPAAEGAAAAGPEGDGDQTAQDTSAGLLEEQPGRETIPEDFMAACHYIKDRLPEVATPDKELREALTVLYQEWFRVSSQKESLVDTVTLYLKEVGAATPTLLRFIVNLADGNGNTALHYSVSHSNFPIVKLLLDTGLCEVDHQNKAGYTAIMLASLTAAESPEDMEVALQLLKGGNVNARATQAGQTALMLAASHGRTAMVRLLLSCDADLSVQDHDGSTALMCACEHGHAEIVRLLLERPDCDLSLTDREGHDALMVAMQASHSEIVDLLKAQTSEGASDTPKPL